MQVARIMSSYDNKKYNANKSKKIIWCKITIDHIDHKALENKEKMYGLLKGKKKSTTSM